MPLLRDILLEETRQPAVVGECTAIVDHHVADRKGLRGAALKTGLALLRSVRADAVERGLEHLLPGFVSALEPLYAEYYRTARQTSFGTYLHDHRDAAIAAILDVSDERVSRSGNRTIRAAYRKLRGFAHDEIAIALPAIGTLIDHQLAHG